MYLKFIAIFLLFSGCVIKSSNKKHQNIGLHTKHIHNQDSVILQLKKELNNQQIADNFSILTFEMINTLEKSKSDVFMLFPYSEIDSAILSETNTHSIIVKTLDEETTIDLIKLLNNPLNFQWGECGTPVEEYKFTFYNKGHEIAKTTISCLIGFIECEPKNILSRNGGLNSKGRLGLKAIIDSGK